MKSWHEFFTMGGYAVYVWPAYGVALVVMIANAILPDWHHRTLLKALRRRARNHDRTP